MAHFQLTLKKDKRSRLTRPIGEVFEQALMHKLLSIIRLTSSRSLSIPASRHLFKKPAGVWKTLLQEAIYRRSFLPERTSQPRCDLRPDAFPLQTHVAGDHGNASCFASRHPAHASPCGESPFRQKGPTTRMVSSNAVGPPRILDSHSIQSPA